MVDKNRKVVDIMQDLIRHENEMNEYLKDIISLTEEIKLVNKLVNCAIYDISLNKVS